jgi:hypothetical protein
VCPRIPNEARRALPAGLFSDCGGALAGTTETRNVLFLGAAA